MKETDFKAEPIAALDLTPEQAETLNQAYTAGEHVLIGYATRYPFPDHEKRRLVAWSVTPEQMADALKAAGVQYKRRPKPRQQSRSG